MDHVVKLQGRELTCADITFVRHLIKQHPQYSRRKLSIALSEAWQWYNANGTLKDMACRSLLNKLHERQLIELPPRRQSPTSRMSSASYPLVKHDTTAICGPLHALKPLRVITVHREPDTAPLCNHLLSRYHYLGFSGTVGENMKYLIVDRYDRPVACLLFGSSAWSCADRDIAIGWDNDARQRNICFTTNNTRFLILPWVSVTHLASHILAMISRRIRADWRARYGHDLYLLETFVDTQRFAGTCYRAANWHVVGQTRGRTRNDRFSTIKVSSKSVLVYPLVTDFRSRLQL